MTTNIAHGTGFTTGPAEYITFGPVRFGDCPHHRYARLLAVAVSPHDGGIGVGWQLDFVVLVVHLNHRQDLFTCRQHLEGSTACGKHGFIAHDHEGVEELRIHN